MINSNTGLTTFTRHNVSIVRAVQCHAHTANTCNSTNALDGVCGEQVKGCGLPAPPTVTPVKCRYDSTHYTRQYFK